MELSIKQADILLPKVGDKTAFACIACDQFTGDQEYWNELDKLVGDKKSALRLTLPEIYLEDNPDERVKEINKNISQYLEEGVFETYKNGFILTVRKTAFVEKRVGLMAALDLDKYDYKKGSTSEIRATEGTIEERIPPRLKIRKNAKIEFPHIMVLIDDEKREIIEKLYEQRNSFKKIYDFELNMDGGHIEGYFIEDYNYVLSLFKKLYDEKRLMEKYGKTDKFIFAVGDGNHSLATAKAFWEMKKEGLTKEQLADNPAKYALCEIVNIYDEGIYFEPIYRFIKDVDVDKFLQGFKDIDCGDVKIYANKTLTAQKTDAGLPQGIKATDEYIKAYFEKNGGYVDYIHGEEEIKKLVDDNNGIAILFNKMDKGDLFKYVSSNGALPRKTFSMGEGKEKRYYLEGRIISK